MSDIGSWLKGHGLGKFATVFLENEIEVADLVYLTEVDLEKLGLPMGPRKRLLAAVACDDSLADELVTVEEPATGSPELAPKARGAERRQLTVMFCDLVGSTELSQQLDPEELREVNRIYQDTAKAVIEEYEGYVARYMGDGVLAYFGYPLAHEDDAERAVRVGLRLTEAVPAAAPDRALLVRVGIATGPVVVGDVIGEGASQESAVVGETPNLASRLQGVAGPNCVVASEVTHRLVGDVIRWRALEGLDLKGFGKPVLAWQAISVSEALSRFEALRERRTLGFVGRRAELALLDDRWEQAREREGQVVLISGEGGIGKSRLLATFRERMPGDVSLWLTYQCSSLHTNSALYPVLRHLSQAASLETTEDHEEKLRRLADLLGGDQEATSMFAELLSVSAPDDSSAATSLTPQAQRQRRIRVLMGRLEHLAREGPVVMLFEDVHWADPSTLEVLDALVERVSGLAVLVLITYRPEFGPTWGAHGQVTGLTLNRLSRAQCQALIRQAMDNVTEELANEIYSRTDGIPLHVEELTRSLVEQGNQAATAVPATLQDSLLARLDRIGDAKELAQAAAVIGREFEYELLGELMAGGEVDVGGGLGRLEESGLIFRRGEPPDAKYTFKHALVRDTAYGSLLRDTRRTLHGRVARLLESRRPAVTETHPQIIAHHLTEAGLAETAVAYWRRAGEQSRGRSANQEAVAHLEAAMSTLESLPESESRDREELQIQMLLGNALLSTRGYNAQETAAAFARADELAQRMGTTRERLEALWGRAANAASAARLHELDEICAAFMPLARQEADSSLISIGHRLSWWPTFQRGDFASALEHARLAFELYPEVDDGSAVDRFGHHGRVMSLVWQGLTQWALGYLDQAARSRIDALSLGDRSGHATTRAAVLMWGGLLLGACLRDEEAVAQSIDAVQRLGGESPEASAQALIFEGWLEAHSGDAGAAVPRIEQGISRLADVGQVAMYPIYLGILSEARIRASDLEGARQSLIEGCEFSANADSRCWLPDLMRLHADIDRLNGAEKQAESKLTQSLETAREVGSDLLQLRAAVSLARLRDEPGPHSEAIALLASIYDRFTEGFDTPDLREASALLIDLK